jgi:vesicle-associated membrane protein-associated protein A
VSRGHSHDYADEEHLGAEVPIMISSEEPRSPSPPPPPPPHPECAHEEPQHIYEPPPPRVATMDQPPPPSTIETVYVENPLNEELLAKYKEAQAEIGQLRNTIATMSVAPTSELRSRRSRKHSDAASTSDTDVQTVIDDHHYRHQQDGVPLPVVVIVALGVFITTYLFF